MNALKKMRLKRRLSQEDIAKKMGSLYNEIAHLKN